MYIFVKFDGQDLKQYDSMIFLLWTIKLFELNWIWICIKDTSIIMTAKDVSNIFSIQVTFILMNRDLAEPIVRLGEKNLNFIF